LPRAPKALLLQHAGEGVLNMVGLRWWYTIQNK
jgi:hypothetical protein